MAIGTKALYDEATASLKRIQDFDVQSLPRSKDLGAHLNFSGAVEPAQRLVELFGRLSPESLQDFPDPTLTAVRDQANNIFNLFNSAISFDPGSDNPKNQQQQIIQKITAAYPPAFQALHPFIAYSLHRSADFQRLDAQARATLQGVEDRASAFDNAMKAHEEDARRVLEEIRKVAAEEGVTQQAAHFRAESEAHELKATEWQQKTVKLAWGLGFFAVLSLFLHKLPILVPVTTYDTVQLAISKVLVFAVITYMLVLSARNFMSHKHNAVINKHRQNALMTHRALVEAASESGARDAIMIHAASCIFAPQPTGYTDASKESDSGGPRSVVELASRSAAAVTKQSN